MYAGYYGVAMGHRANASTNGTAIGAFATSTNSGATTLGYNARATYANSTALGNQAQATFSNRFVLGNSSINDLRCQDTSISTVSDRRDKTDIADLTLGLDFVNSITPKSYRKNNRGQYYTEVYTDEQLRADPT